MQPKLQFHKTVYNVSAKSAALIKEILFIEIQRLIKKNEQYSFGGLSEPVNNSDGSATYTITLVLNEVNVKS